MGNNNNPWRYDTTATYNDVDLRPSDDCMRPENTTERVALVIHHLYQGEVLTTAELANIAGMSWQGAEDLLDRASRVTPLTKYDGRWRMISNE